MEDNKNYKYVEPYWKVDDDGLSHIIKESEDDYVSDIHIPKDVLVEAFKKFMPNVQAASSSSEEAPKYMESEQPTVNVPSETDITYFQLQVAATEVRLNELSNLIVEKYGIEVWGFALKQIINDVVSFCGIAYEGNNNIPAKFISLINQRDSTLKKRICKYISYNSGVKFNTDDYFWIIISELMYFLQH